MTTSSSSKRTPDENDFFIEAKRKLEYKIGPLTRYRDTREQGEINRTVIEGTLAFNDPDQVAASAVRYIPIDIYLARSLRTEIRNLNTIIDEFFEALGFRFLSCDVIADGSVHSIAVVETPPMTSKEFDALNEQLSFTFQALNGMVARSDGKDEPPNGLDRQKIAAEIRKLEAETRKLGVDTDQAKATINKTKVETFGAAVDAFNKFAMALLKISAGVVMLIGTISVTVRPADFRPAVNQVHVQQVDRMHNLKSILSYLEQVK
jgi:hypothetical protein